MTTPCLGILLPDDGPDDYEWHELGGEAVPGEGALPAIAVGKVASDGHHEPGALTALGAVERLAPVGERLVRERGARAVVWACTSGSFIGGLAWARAQAAGLEARLGVPVTSTALAFREALEALGERRVDLLSPYPQDVTDRLVRFLGEDGGAEVARVEALDCPFAADSHRLDIVAAVAEFARAHPADDRPLLVPDTAVNTLRRLEAMASAAGRPLLTANQVTLWAGLERLGWASAPAGYLRQLAGRGQGAS